MGDPVQIELRGYELTLRLDEARKNEIENVHQKAIKPYTDQRTASVAHPGMGKLGRAKGYHIHDTGNEIPKGERITFALVGNQNCGKTTLFNQLTYIGARCKGKRTARSFCSYKASEKRPSDCRETRSYP